MGWRKRRRFERGAELRDWVGGWERGRTYFDRHTYTDRWVGGRVGGWLTYHHNQHLNEHGALGVGDFALENELPATGAEVTQEGDDHVGYGVADLG